MRPFQIILILFYVILVSLYFLYGSPLSALALKTVNWSPMTILIFTITIIICYFTILQIMIHQNNLFLYTSIFTVPISNTIKYLLSWKWPIIGVISSLIFFALSLIFIIRFKKEISIIKNMIICTGKILQKHAFMYLFSFLIYFIIQFQSITVFKNRNEIHKIDYTFVLFINGLINCLLCHLAFHVVITELIKPEKNINFTKEGFFSKIIMSILLSTFLSLLSLINIILFDKIKHLKKSKKFILKILIKCTSIFLISITDLIFIFNYKHSYYIALLKTLKCYKNHVCLLFYLQTIKRVLSLAATPLFNFLYEILISKKLSGTYRNCILKYINPKNINFEFPVFVVSDYFCVPFMAMFIILLEIDEAKNINQQTDLIDKIYDCKAFEMIKKQILSHKDTNKEAGYFDIFIMKILSLQNMSFLHK
ncbi:hypothetical protein CDIK_2078 [Cucumispora dikerogammari]|nr:hypothetical protein CDIK_2078 [Cucumispora dikerogammari]